jgi:hypothetical protein
MRWAGNVAHKADGRGAYRVWIGRPKGKIHLEDLGVDGKIILKWTFKKWGREACRFGCSGLG